MLSSLRLSMLAMGGCMPLRPPPVVCQPTVTPAAQPACLARVSRHHHPLPSPVPLCSLVGYSANTGDPNGDTRFQRWDARLGRSVLRQQDQIAVMAGGLGDGCSETAGNVAC